MKNCNSLLWCHCGVIISTTVEQFYPNNIFLKLVYGYQGDNSVKLSKKFDTVMNMFMKMAEFSCDVQCSTLLVDKLNSLFIYS